MKTSVKLLILMLGLVFINSGFLYAQNTITGNVTEKGSNNPVIGANIAVKGTNKGATSDANGVYKIAGVPEGDLTMVVTSIGYVSEEMKVQAKAGETTTLDITLIPDIISLEQVVVTGTVNKRSALESSVAITSLQPKSIGKIGAVTTAELFRAIPGVHSEATGGEGNANISMRGIPISTGGSKFMQLWEDGLPVLQFGDIICGNADIFLRSDQTVARIEAIKGGSASTFASNSPAGIINFISKNGSVEGGSIGSTFGLDYKDFRTDFEYGTPMANGFKFHIGGFFRQGEGPRKVGYTANYGGQIKANLTKEFKKGFVRLYFKHLDDRAISYMPMPIMATGTGLNPKYEKIPGFDPLKNSMQSPDFQHILSVDASGNSRTSNIADGMHPVSDAIGTEFSFDLGDGWKIQDKGRMAWTHGSFNSPFPGGVGTVDNVVNGILAGSGLKTNQPYTLSYANGGAVIPASDYANLNGNGLLMTTTVFDTDLDNLNNFTNDVFVTKTLGKVNITAGYYKAFQNIAAHWFWQGFVTDVSSQPRLVNIATAFPQSDSSYYTENGQTDRGAWGGCCVRGYDMRYAIDAPYANVNAELIPNVNVDASIRYDFGTASGYYLSNKQATVDVNNDGTISPIEKKTTVLDNSNPHPVNYSFDYVSYSIGANYKLDSHKAVFARQSSGGRANADRLLYSPFITATGGVLDGLQADRVNQTDLGFKYNSPKVAFTVTGFYATISEQNQDKYVIINNSYKSYGLELEAVVNIKKLNVTAGATYNKAKITKALDKNVEGNTPRRMPDLMYNFSPMYTFGIASVGFSLIGTTKVFSQDDNKVVLPGYAYVNAFASLSVAKGLSVKLASNNLTNTFGLTEMEEGGGGFVDNSKNYLRARAMTGRSTTLSIIYSF